jgi:hypothetical protein
MVTKNREVPTPLTKEPLSTIQPYRGTLVFFNPATFFIPLATGYSTLKAAGEAGVKGNMQKVDFKEGVGSSFNHVSQALHSRVAHVSKSHTR